MTDFGRYRISYEPGPFDPYSGVLEHAVEMSISGQASIEQMLSFFDAFLKANGYVYDGEVTILDETPRPLFQTTAQGSQGVDFVPFSSCVEDAVSFGVS